MMKETRAKTRGLLAAYLLLSTICLSTQAILTVLSWWLFTRRAVNAMHPHSGFLCPIAFSAFVTITAYLVMLRAYHPEHGHYLLHGVCWCSLFLPQLLPTLRYGLAIFQPTWAVILASTATAGLVFQDMMLVPGVAELHKEAAQFVHGELRFYLDKVFVAVLTLGTGVAAMMTILWTAPEHAFDMIRAQREFWAVYSLICFVAVGGMLSVAVLYPTIRGIQSARKRVLEPNHPQERAQSGSWLPRVELHFLAIAAALAALCLRRWMSKRG
jgi:hypothetical protein